MLDKIDFLIRFWELRARHENGEFGTGPLGQTEQRELLSLLHLVTEDLKVPEPCALPNVPNVSEAHCPAYAIGEGEVLSVDIRVVTAAALVVTAARRLPEGAAVIVRATDAVLGVEYSLPCHVAWVQPSAPVTMALVVDGVPTRAPFDTDDDAHTALARRARPVFGMSRAPRPSAAARRH